MEEDYRDLVLRLLKKQQYPVLQQFVILDVYYKMIPLTLQSVQVQSYHRKVDDPYDVYMRDTQPYLLSYLVQVGDHLYLHHVSGLDAASWPTECIRIRFPRSLLDKNVLEFSSATFEEELYRFLTYLNFDVPKIASFLNMDMVTSTRFLPQRIVLWPGNFSVHPIVLRPVNELERSCFGPTRETIPVRLLRGRLAPCTSRSALLSLNNDIAASHLTYVQHYAEAYKSLIPLAYNPLENPIVV